MKLKIQDIKGKSHGELEVKLELIDNGRGSQAVHDTVVGRHGKDGGRHKSSSPDDQP